jgi:hypothetical protein
MYRKITLAKLAAIVLMLVLVGLGIFANRTNSQTKLKDIPLSAAQNTDIKAADKEIEQAQTQIRTMIGNRQMLARGFAISAGIKSDELFKFKLELKGDGYHFLERTEAELKQIADEQKKLAEQGNQ